MQVGNGNSRECGCRSSYIDGYCIRHLRKLIREDPSKYNRLLNIRNQQMDDELRNLKLANQRYKIARDKRIRMTTLTNQQINININEMHFCGLCSKTVENSKVILDCKCTFHLDCYTLIRNEQHCVNCFDKIKSKKYKKCSICLEKIKGKYSKTGCNHFFHKNCLDNWINIGKHTCPNCRHTI